jgi:hypothetical protein
VVVIVRWCVRRCETGERVWSQKSETDPPGLGVGRVAIWGDREWSWVARMRRQWSWGGAFANARLFGGVGAKKPKPSYCASVSGCIWAGPGGGRCYDVSVHPPAVIWGMRVGCELVWWEGVVVLTMSPATLPASPSLLFTLPSSLFLLIHPA